MLHRIRKRLLRESVSYRAMLTAQFHFDRLHPAPWRERQDRHLVQMLTKMIGAANAANAANAHR